MLDGDSSVAPYGAELVALIGGLFIPYVVNMVKRATWGETVRVAVAYIFCALWTGLAFWLTERIVFDNPIDWRQMVLMSFAVFSAAHVTFKAYWQAHPSGSRYLERARD